MHSLSHVCIHSLSLHSSLTHCPHSSTIYSDMALHPCVCCKPYQNQCWHIITVRAPAIQLRIILHALDITNKIPFEIYTLKIIIHVVYLKGHSVKSLWPHDAIWRHRSGSKLARLTACCMMPPSLCLNQCWLTISKVRWHSLEGIIVRRYEDSNQQIMIENIMCKIASRFLRRQ